MQVQSTDTPEKLATAALNELQLGDRICVAVTRQQRADFALLVAMFSDDVRETAPAEVLDQKSGQETPGTETPSVDTVLRREFLVADSQPLRSDQNSYSAGAQVAKQFHEGGMQSARLQNGLNPDALAYIPENVHGLGEEVYRNLSFHTQRTLKGQSTKLTNDGHLYRTLVTNNRESQINTYL